MGLKLFLSSRYSDMYIILPYSILTDWFVFLSLGLGTMSHFDVIYRRFLLTKFFTKGWGDPQNLKR